MKQISLSLVAAALLFAACGKNGGSGSQVTLKNQEDSVMYAIGTQVGAGVHKNLIKAGLDSGNVDLLLQGMRHGYDSTYAIPEEQLSKVVERYMRAEQDRQTAKENAEAEERLKAGQEWLAENGKRTGVTTTASGLQYEVITMGTGPTPAPTDEVEVNYRGTLTDGHEFDSSYKRGQPAKFPVQSQGMIAGWGEALQLMPVGSKWKVYIPSGLGFGAQAQGNDIPANSVLVFELELLKILPKTEEKTK
ncbi:MAG TPA: FKBP-type peptidyl-prolyl cis-trans isomerase [Flavobacteriales bacterium]|jgi:FKBP-type peptidyl-prolyl cis-trans isomerase|nr:FKBP-type peptidyl-prolyl cis-trans isomerase [Flavobacteriales bacterium]